MFSHIYVLNSIETKNSDVTNTSEQSKIELLISTMTTEEKVGQLFICGYRKDISGQNMYLLNDYLNNTINKYNTKIYF